MKIAADTRIPFPRERVYTTFRDRFAQIVPYLSDMRAFYLKSRQQTGSRVDCVSEWHGGGDIPGVAKAFLSEAMLAWTEYDTWRSNDWALDWHIETHAFTQAVHCAGCNRFLEAGGATRIETRGAFIIDAKQLQGVPPFLAGRIARIVEDLLGQKIANNLEQVSQGVRQYLQQRERAPQ